MKLEENNIIVKRSYKTVYKCDDSIVKVFNEEHPKSDVFNEALITARIEETGLDIPKVKGASDYQTAEGALESQQPVSGLQKTSPEGVELPITVNGDPVVLKNKKEYILVDVLDFYPFDLSVAKGNRLETLINGVSSDFTSPVHENDEVKIYWV